jgi:uncharacterized phage infection (PIP) family protein YhgE
MPQHQDGNSISGGLRSDGDEIMNPAHDQADGARRAFDETAAELSQAASSLAEDAKDAALEKVEDAKDGLSGSLQQFGEALRAAGDRLAQGQPDASRIVTEAAAGLERLSGSVESKPLSEIIDEIRSFGSRNAGGLFGGAVVAGLALGRLLKAGQPHASAKNSTQPTSTDEAASRQIAGAGQ